MIASSAAISSHYKDRIPGLYADALPETIGGVPPRPVPTGCPVMLDELLAE
jgi:hypothetical protein